MENIGALWVNTSKKNGSKFMAGEITINGVTKKILVFKNVNKKEDRHPDFNIILGQDRSQQKQPERKQERSPDVFDDF